jgi:hypothetical protein
MRRFLSACGRDGPHNGRAVPACRLHSFTVGAPLSFLDHHLRAGDSVIGAWVRPTVYALQKRGALFNLSQIARVERVSSLMTDF